MSDIRREQSEGHPTGDFDKTPMGNFKEHLTVPSDPSTLPESMPPIDETVPPPLEHQYPKPEQDDSDMSRKWLKPLAVVAGLAALGTAYLLGTKSDDTTNPETSAAPTTEVISDDEPGSTTTTEIPTTSTTETGNIDSVQRVTVNGTEMLVGSPEASVEESMDIIAANLTTALNFVDFSTPEEQTAAIEAFLPYILYDVNSDLADQYREMIRSAQNYRQGDIFTEYAFSYRNLEIVENPSIPNAQEARADVSDGVSPNPTRKLVTLLPKDVHTEEGTKTSMLLAYEQPA